MCTFKKWQKKLHTIDPLQYLHILHSMKDKFQNLNFSDRKPVLNLGFK